jgi:hypothetical protein
MKRSILMMGVASLLLPLMVTGQVRNEDLSSGILAARKKQAALLQQYNWSSSTQVLEDNKIQDIRVDSVSSGPNGQPQRTLVNDQPAQLPDRVLRKAVAEKKRKELEQYIAGLAKLLDQYTLPSAGKIFDFLAQARVSPTTTPDGRTVLQVSGNSVVVPEDTFAMTVDGRTLLPTSTQITTSYNGDPVTVSATFRTMPSGLNHLQYATVSAPKKKLTLMIHNYDYIANQ